MALLGGGVGGAGNPVGGSFTGPAQALEIIADFAYAASGNIEDAGTGGPNTTLLSFTTGNYLFVGDLDFTNSARLGHDIYLNVTMNGNIINETQENSTGIVPMTFHYIIPPYTEITVEWGANSTYNGSAFMSGRIYRTRD